MRRVIRRLLLVSLAFAYGIALPKPVTAAQTIVSLTFDDGYNDAPQAAQILGQFGMKGTFYIISGVLGTGSPYMTLSQVQAIQAAGHEIAGHTISHPDLATLTLAQAQNEICGGRTQLVNMGFQPVSFAYPFGSANSAIESIVASCYTSGRGAWQLGCNYDGCSPAESIPPVDPYWIRTPDAVLYTTTLAQLKAQVTVAENAGGGWVPMQFHHVCDGCDGTDSNAYSVSPANLTAFLTWLQARASLGTVVETVSQVMGGTPPPPPPPPPPPVTSSTMTIFNNSVPGDGASDPNPLEIGVKFRSDVNGYVQGLRFYKRSTNTGTHTGHLWTRTGTLLASVTYTGETASGWQQMLLSTPVAISANTTYVASYFTTKGYSVDVNYFNTAKDSPPLHALQTGVDGPNGVYLYSAYPAFPTNGSGGRNYWVDVIFSSTVVVSSATNPAPILSSISPSSVTAGGPSFTLSANGANFISSSTIQWNGSLRSTTFISGTSLTMVVPASDIVSSGTASITVFTPAPGGGTSVVQTLTISAPPPPPNPVPSLLNITPSSATAGAASFIMTANGTNFVSNATVLWNGASRSTTFVSSTTLTASIPSTDVTSPGIANLTVFNPAPGGGTSSAQTFTIVAGPPPPPPPPNPIPTLTGISPSSATAGGPGFTLSLAGANFISSSTVQWNGVARATTFISSVSLSASILANDILSTGTANVTVFNPATGGGTSAPQVFTIQTPAVGSQTTIFTSQVPNDGTSSTTPVELGMKFRSDVNGYIVGLRFYKRSTNTGAHIGHLWTNTGTLLATITYTGETATGWQTAYLSSPVAITANTTYVVSYFTKTGYSVNINYFTVGVDNAPLHALASGVDGLNGVYIYSSAGAFPTQSTRISNYWVDVVFNTTPTHSNSLAVNPNSLEPDALAFTDLTQTRVFPNPWRAGRSANNYITFDQLASNSTVKIFTVSAHWVRTLDAPTGSVTWDLKNDSGDAVASGYYIYLITNASAEKAHGTMAVVR